MTLELLKTTVANLTQTSTTMAALAAALDARTDGSALPPEIAPHVERVVACLGLTETIDTLASSEARAALGELRTFSLSTTKLMYAASRGAGWRHDEAALLEAAGDVSTPLASLMARAIAPELEGLTTALAGRGATFLDVGTGVGTLAIEMARIFPSLRVVGIDPWRASLDIARERSRRSGLSHRLELRQQAAEDLTDEDAFDLVWIAGLFLPERSAKAAVKRVLQALRPGGWLIMAVMPSGRDDLSTAIARLRTASFGGWVTTGERIAALLGESGFVEVRPMGVRPVGPAGMVVGRRAGGR